MKEIPLTKGKVALVDDEDYDRLMAMGNWYVSKNGYAISSKNLEKMHRVIMNPLPHELVDHMWHDKLDNRKCNLRIVSKEENIHNQRKRQGSLSSNYKGVSWRERKNAFEARCRMYGQDFHLGLFKSEIAAAYAYNKKASELSYCALLNDLPFSVGHLESLLLSDRYVRKKAEFKSAYKGVFFNKKSGRMKSSKWCAIIRVDNKNKFIGYFNNETEAAQAYNEAAIKYHGEFAKLNEIPGE